LCRQLDLLAGQPHTLCDRPDCRRSFDAQLHGSEPAGSVYPGTFSEYQDPSEYQKPEYPNHKPLRGNYPGSYPSSSSMPVQQLSSQFDWLAALVGAAGMLGLILLLTAVKTGARRARDRRQDVPLVVQIDEPPSVG
jgi:hypothetical protein